MTASLYQVASSSAKGALRNERAWHPHDVGRRDCWVQLDVVPAVGAPGVTCAVQQVFDAVWWMASARHHRQLHPARLRPGGVEVDDHDDDVGFPPTSTLLLRGWRAGARLGVRE